MSTSPTTGEKLVNKKPNRIQLPNYLVAITELSAKALERQVNRLSVNEAVKLQKVLEHLNNHLASKLESYSIIEKNIDSLVKKLQESGLTEREINQALEARIKK